MQKYDLVIIGVSALLEEVNAIVGGRCFDCCKKLNTQ